MPLREGTNAFFFVPAIRVLDLHRDRVVLAPDGALPGRGAS